MSEWKEYRLGDVGTVITGKTPSSSNPEDFGTYIPFVTPTDYKDYHKIVSFANRSLSLAGAEKLKNKILPPKSVMVTCIGSDMGKVVINTVPVLTNQQINSIIPNEERIDSDFLYYKLVSLYDILRSYGLAGTTMPIVNKGDFEDITISMPSIPEQRAIAAVLSSLDDKIDLLHRQNKSLESLAETLWRKMFIEEADSKWPANSLGNIFDVGIGRTPPRKEQRWFTANPCDVKWISIKDMGNCGVYINSVSEYLTKEAVKEFNIPRIPSNTVLLSFKMTVGRVAITTDEMVSNEAIAHFKTNKSSYLTSEYLYFFLKIFKYESLGSTSSIVEAINSQMIKDIEVSVPTNAAMAFFQDNVMGYFDKIRKNEIQIRTLLHLRNALLPKLISGEVKALS